MALLWTLPGCSRSPTENSDASAPTYERRPANSPRTEAAWIVQSITEEVVRLAAYAAKLDPDIFKAELVAVTTPPGDASGCHFAVEIHLPNQDALQTSIEIKGAIWDPQAYVSLTREVFARLHLDQPKLRNSIGGKPLASLSSPRAEVIQGENRRISHWLTDHPLDAEAHEQAALLIGTLGMRENCGPFFDTRVVCNRAAAHLAFASALHSGPARGDFGAVAELLIGLLIDTKGDCEQRIEALAARAAAHPELKPWVMAGRLRNRRDYRIMPDASKGTLLEQLELFRAMNEAAGTTAACKALGSILNQPIADWSRILLQFSFNVDQGHRFTPRAVALELEEAAKVWPDFNPSRPSPDSIAKAFNRQPQHITNRNPDGSINVEVIDDGTWAMFLQRHLCAELSRTHYFLSSLWAVKDAAEGFKASTSVTFRKMSLFPLVSVDSWDAAWKRDEGAAIARLINAHPEWMPDGLWFRSREGRPVTKDENAPSFAEWFVPGLPPGTAYCFWARSVYLHDVSHMTEAEAKKLHEIAPWHYGVSRHLAAIESGGKASPEHFKEIVGEFLEYYNPAMLDYSALIKEIPAKFSFIMRRMAKQDPGQFVELCNYLVARHMEKEAVAAYESAFAHNADAIQISNSCEWLVIYYADHGRVDRAMEIAKFGAETYSEQGLETMAKLLDRLDKPAEAEEYYLKIRDRYQYEHGLSGLYFRERVKHPKSGLAAKYPQFEKARFPNGVRNVTINDFKTAPRDGVLIRQENDLVNLAGMKASDIIVAIDGKQVQTFDQYLFIREQTVSDDMNLVVFSNGRYQDIHAKVPGQRLRTEMVTYKP